MDEASETGVDDRMETSSVKFCVDCKHYKLEDLSKEREALKEEGQYALMSYYVDKHQCFHPSYETTDIVTGKTLKNEKDCYVARGNNWRYSDKPPCDKEAKLWEPKE